MSKVKIRFFVISIVCLAGLAGLAVAANRVWGPRTFVFYAVDENKEVVEKRRIARAESVEADIRRYVEDALLGPASLEAAPLFPPGTRVETLMLRGDVVYINLSEDAAVPYRDSRFRRGSVYASLVTLELAIKRNFPKVRETRFFIAGNETYADFTRSDFTRNTASR
jgi:hypothetical protein